MSLPAAQKHLNVESTSTLRPAQRKKVKTAAALLILGIVCLILSILCARNDFLELALNERIKLRPGLPPYEKWKNPSTVDFGIRVFLFAVENPDEFLANNKTKLKLKEIGPIYYKKTMRQEDIVFNEEDSTMSFSTIQDVEFVEEMNEPGILNKTITLINPVLLGLAAIVHDHFFFKVAFDMAAQGDHVFINRTVYEVLWNITSPTLELVKKIPFAAPRPNAGVMFNSFYPTPTRYNVNIGPKHGFKNFFKINTLNGLSRISVYKESYPKHCPYSLKGSSEGTGLPPMLSKDTVIQFFSNNLCRTYPMIYNQTVKVGMVDAYEFVFDPAVYKRMDDPSKDCFKQTGKVTLPDGLIDASKCAFETPVALSHPHFWSFQGEWENYLEGIKPRLEDHASYINVEPVSGIQLKAMLRMQSNIPLPSLDYYPPNIRRFSRMILPQFWMEFSVTNGDPFINGLIILFVNMPVIQPIILIILLTSSVLFIYKGVKLMVTLNLSRFWNRAKKQNTIYPTTTERYIETRRDD